MTENEKLKPPARPKGRVLGGANKKTTPPPPPPAAELTPQQYAAEQAADQSKGHRPAVSESQDQSAPAPAVGDRLVEDRAETAPGVPQASATPSARLSEEVVESGPVLELVSSEPSGVAESAPNARLESAVGSAGLEVRAQAAVPAAGTAVQPTQQAEPVSQSGPPQSIPAAPSVGQAAEVAVRPAVRPVVGGAAFPVRAEGPGSRQEREVRSDAAHSEGTPWAQGSGRPVDIPEAAVVLNQRVIARESLDSSVPAALKLKKRIKRFALDNELDHLPIGDIVSVALDEWLTTRGF
ncbi:hypothetical protein QFZ24_002531 [Streptomyces phaeochromogenes]|uniref:hypothetical protein n=1 Tax=Streptomyces phaeochromogenes TaxID=1923 RepID=UPI00278DE8B8|nr:hypothetical protein [Streptomyces phaeochromogenes]MDQ0948608.1 hypothetical protein [Streptomyces phaeochromogenes]